MIEGLKFHMPADELREHLSGRIGHHQGRVTFYTKKADELDAGKTEGMNYTNGDPVRSLRDKSTEHGEKAKLFQFMHDHVVKGETYQLGDADLQRLEIIGRNHW